MYHTSKQGVFQVSEKMKNLTQSGVLCHCQGKCCMHTVHALQEHHAGFWNHICALLYQASHYSKRQLDTVLPDGSKTNVPQTWDKPRIHGITPEPVMPCTVKKVKLDGANSQCIQSTAYEARMKNVIPNDP